MNMKKNKQFWFYLFLGLAPLVLLGCFVEEEEEILASRRENDEQIQAYIATNLPNAQGTGSGLFYEIIQTNPNGQEINDGDSVRVHFVLSLLSGTIVDSTRGATKVLEGQALSSARPDKFLISASNLPLGLEEGIKLLKEGERAILLVPSYLGFSANGTSLIPPFSVLLYDILVEEVKSEEEQIEEYITLKSLNITTTTESRLRYIREAEGSPNTKPEEGQTVFVTYQGNLLNDAIFDQNSDTTFSFVVGRNSVIAGWEEGIKLMNEGETATFIIPSELAYGTSGSGNNIPPYAPLAFTLTLVKSERQQLFDYIAANGLAGDTSSTQSGLLYAIQENGTGTQNPLASSSVEIRYTASYLDSENNLITFETATTPVTFTLSDTDNPIHNEGLVEGIRLMKVGEKRLLLMTSVLGFGQTGQRAVPRRTPLIYEVELINIL